MSLAAQTWGLGRGCGFFRQLLLERQSKDEKGDEDHQLLDAVLPDVVAVRCHSCLDLLGRAPRSHYHDGVDQERDTVDSGEQDESPKDLRTCVDRRVITLGS